MIDGNRRFTALRDIEKKSGIKKCFNAVILELDVGLESNLKTIKELELDLQLAREERISYNPIDRIFDVYNTIEVQKLMTVDEYKKAAGEKNTKKIKRDIRLAKLIIKFIEIISPGGNPIDKFYLARELKLDGPIEEIEGTLEGLKSKNKNSITEAVLIYLAATKTDDKQQDSTRLMRDLKNNVLKNDEVLQYFYKAVDDKVDVIMEAFEEKPISSAKELKVVIEENIEVDNCVKSILNSTNKLIIKSNNDNKRTKSILSLESIYEELSKIRSEDFNNLTSDEKLEAKEILKGITDLIQKMRKF